MSIIISVIIPVRNGAATLGRCLESLKKQTVWEKMEIIVLDTMSTDGSRDIALAYGTKVISINNEAFDHGLTRNIGVEQAAGNLIYLTVQDAWIPDSEMLAKMSNHFVENKQTVAVCGHQAVPHEKDKNPMLWFRPVSQPGITVKSLKSPESFGLLSQKQQQAAIAWDNVVAMYRKEALSILPFVRTAYAEDWVWSLQAQLKGWTLLHDASLVVYHYHHQSFQFTFKTKYTISYHFKKFFGFEPELPPIFLPIVRTFYHIGKNKQLTWKEKFYWTAYNMEVIAANLFAVCNFRCRSRWFGAKAVECGYRKYCSTIPQGVQKRAYIIT